MGANLGAHLGEHAAPPGSRPGKVYAAAPLANENALLISESDKRRGVNHGHLARASHSCELAQKMETAGVLSPAVWLCMADCQAAATSLTESASTSSSSSTSTSCTRERMTRAMALPPP